MPNLYGRSYLQNKLKSVRSKVNTKYRYYDLDNKRISRSLTIPSQVLEAFKPTLGWCQKSVDLLSDRLIVSRFKNDTYNMQSIFEANNSDILFESSFKGALISGCDFFYVRKDDSGQVRIQVVGGGNATGILDDTTSLLTEGYAVLKRSVNDDAVLMDAYFTPTYTEFVDYENGKSYSIPNNTGNCLLVPIINNPKEGGKPFGRSRISASMMDIQDKAEDLIARLNVLAEVNSWPQKWVSGLSEYTEFDEQRATFSSMLRFDKDEDGDRPSLGQFTQMSFADHISAFDAYVSMFAGMSSLTRDDLGFVTENPSSSESKKAALESLRVIAGKCKRDFSTALLNVGYVAACLRDDIPYSRQIISQTKIVWKPLVEPDFASLSSIGDGVIKINQAIPGAIDKDTLMDLIGLDAVEVLEDDGIFDNGEEP